MVLIQLIWHDVGSFCGYQILHLVFFTNNRGKWVQLLQIVHDGVLNMYIDLGEDIWSTGALLHRYVFEADIPGALNDLVRAFEQVDAGRHELIQFDDSFHNI